jgi:indole-3-acetate monooxygenase
MQLEIAAVLDRSPSEVFAYIIDCANDPSWRGNIRAAALLRGKPGEVGAAYRMTTAMMGQEIEMEARLVEVVTGSSFAIAVRSPQGDIVTTTRLEPAGEATALTMSTDLTPLGPMANMAAGMMKADFTKDLAALATIMSGEGHQAVPAPLSVAVVGAATDDQAAVAQPSVNAAGVASSTSAPVGPSHASTRPRGVGLVVDRGTRRRPDEKSLYEIAHDLEPIIRRFEDQMEIDRTIPDELVDALYDAGMFTAFTPKELGGLEVDPVEWLEMVEELSRISGAVGWLAMVNAGAVQVPRERYDELTDNGRIRWIVAGNAGRLGGKAKRVEGGYLVTGRWPFTSGSQHANFVGGMAVLHDDDDNVVIHPSDGMPWIVNCTFRREDVRLIDTWDGLGVRGSGSGDFEVTDGFIPAWVADRSMKDLNYNLALYRDMGFILAAHCAHAVGLAQAAFDEYISACNALKADGSRRQSELGRHQLHRINVARADALIRSSRLFGLDATQRVWDEIHEHDNGVASMEARAVMFESFAFVVAQCREAVDLLFRSAGVGGVFRGTRMERIFRDMMTVGQHIVVVEERLEEIGNYWITRDTKNPAIPVMLQFAPRTPKPVAAA